MYTGGMAAIREAPPSSELPDPSDVQQVAVPSGISLPAVKEAVAGLFGLRHRDEDHDRHGAHHTGTRAGAA